MHVLFCIPISLLFTSLCTAMARWCPWNGGCHILGVRGNDRPRTQRDCRPLQALPPEHQNLIRQVNHYMVSYQMAWSVHSTVYVPGYIYWQHNVTTKKRYTNTGTFSCNPACHAISSECWKRSTSFSWSMLTFSPWPGILSNWRDITTSHQHHTLSWSPRWRVFLERSETKWWKPNVDMKLVWRSLPLLHLRCVKCFAWT